MLREAGYRQRTDAKELTLIDAENGVEFFYLRPRDIALYVGEGTLDVGITGRDLLLDSGAKAEEVLHARLRPRRASASPARPGAYTDARPSSPGTRIATSYAGVVAAATSSEHGIDATVIRLDGAVETSVQLGVADVIADVVETGSTLRQAGLEVFGEPILESEAVLITRGGAEPPAGFEVFRRRLEGVLVARTYVMMDYDIRAEHVDAGGRADPRHREPDRLAAAPRGLGRGPRDGPARRRPAGHGRALRPRRPRHPAHRHPCLPALSRRRRSPARTPGARSASGSRSSSSAVLLLVVVRRCLVRVRRRDPRQVHVVPARHADRPRAAGVRRRWCRAGPLPGGRRRRSGWWWSTATARREYEWAESSACTCRPGAPWATLDLADGTTVSALGIQGSDGDRARAARPPARGSLLDR